MCQAGPPETECFFIATATESQSATYTGTAQHKFPMGKK